MSTELNDESKCVAVVTLNKAIPWKQFERLHQAISEVFLGEDTLLKPHIDQNSVPKE